LGFIGFNSDESVYSGQAAVLAGFKDFSKYFSIYRAHPLLYQFIVSLVYHFSAVTDIAARLVSTVFGVLTVFVIYLTGKVLYNRNVGLVAAFVLALLPYHIMITRQAMVDVPFSFFFTLTLFFMAKYVSSRNNDNRLYVYAIGACAGLSFLSKEVGFLALLTAAIYMQLTHRLGSRNLAILVLTFFLVASPHLILILTRNEATQNAFLYTQWQFSRQPNHPAGFYASTLAGALGYILSALVILAVVNALKTKVRVRKASGILLMIWIAVPLIFFQLWSTKGFYYLLPLIPALVLLGTSFLFSDWIKKVRYHDILVIAIIPIILLSTNYVISYFFPRNDLLVLAGSGGLPGAREAALWIKQNTPQGSAFMTIGPSMGNIIKFYANRDALALSVSANPANHNPAYTPIINPDIMIKNGEIHYVVYDIYSALRSQHFADKLHYYVTKYNAQTVHTEYKTYRTADGKTVTSPVIIIYVINSIKGGR